MNHNRGVSSPIGVVLLIALVIAGATAVVVFGGGLIEDLSTTAETERAAQEMTHLASESAAVALGGSQQRQVAFDASEGKFTIDDEGSWICIKNGTVDDREYILPEGGEDDESCSENKTYMGSAVYDTGEGTVAYEGGGVWVDDGEGESRMVSPPEFHYRESTLTLPVVMLEGDASFRGSDGQLTAEAGTTDRVDSIENPLADDSGRVYVTVGSAYYEAWGEYMAQRTDGRVVELDHDNETVTVELVVPAPATINNAIYTDSTSEDSVYVQDMEVDSYSADNYSSSNAKENGDVTTEGGANPIKGTVDGDVHTIRNGGKVKIGGGDTPARINGNVHSQQDVTIVNSGSVRDDIYSEETVTLKSQAAVEGDIHAKNVELQNSDITVGGDVRAGNELFFNDGMTVSGDVHAEQIGGLGSTEPDFGGAVYTKDTYGEAGNSVSVPVSGELHADGGIYTADASFGDSFTSGDFRDSGSTYDGNVHVGSDARLSDTNVPNGDVRVGGDLTTEESTDIGEDVYVVGDADLSSTTIDGDLRVGGEIDCSDSTVDGEVHGNVEADSGCDLETESDSSSPGAPESPDDPKNPEPPEEPVSDPPAIEVPDEDEFDPVPASCKNGGTIQVGSGDEHCKLEPGTYKVSKLDIDVGDLTFEEGGDIELYVEGDVSLSGSDGTVTTAPAGEHDATRVEINVLGDSTVDIQQMSFTGVINAPNSKVDMDENNNEGAEVYGAIIAEKVQGDNGAKVHYDEALSGQTVGDGQGDATTIKYLQVTKNGMEIED